MEVHVPMILSHFDLKRIKKAVATDQNVFLDLKSLRAQILADMPEVSL
jgi:hypothetical protein